MGKWTGPIERLDDCRWRIPRDYKQGMRVDGILYAGDELIGGILKDQAAEQVANVAFLPGIQRASLAMPDAHWGYGFPIGGVAATDPEEGGVVSPGGVGYDINCGVRLLRTNLEAGDVTKRLRALVDDLFAHVPCGVGVGGRVTFGGGEQERLLGEGARYVVRKGYGREADIEVTEARGAIAENDPAQVSDRAHARGRDQCGTLGAGNHFVEVQVVDEVYDERVAAVLGLAVGLVTVMIHSGSRGLGHQVCDDFLKRLRRCPERYGIALPDRQLVCAPVRSPEGEAYLKAMRCAANYAWANRQVLTHHVRRAFAKHFGRPDEALGLDLVYDVAHNIAKMEEHEVAGKRRVLCVHRKGATRAFPPGHPEVPARYRAVGQPVIIPGDMGTHSYVLVGAEGALRETFGTTCHGAGRALSRKAAMRSAAGRSIERELAAKGIVARARSRTGLAEEQPDAYKDVNAVVEVVHRAGLARKGCRMKPLGVIKG